MSSQAEIRTQDALEALTAGLQAGEDVETVVAQTAATGSSAEHYVDIVQALHNNLKPEEPSREFSAALLDDLLGEQTGMIQRVRQMPARVHVAAALALIAGFMLFLMRRIFGSDTPQEIQEEAVATPL